jgi:hypothetical protein
LVRITLELRQQSQDTRCRSQLRVVGNKAVDPKFLHRREVKSIQGSAETGCSIFGLLNPAQLENFAGQCAPFERFTIKQSI